MNDMFFDHTCNIYHLKDNDQTIGYGLDNQDSGTYSEIPDIENQICHVHVSGQNIDTRQTDPQRINDLEQYISFPDGTDVRKNSIIEDLTHGVRYTISGPPRNIRGNHIKCMAITMEPQREL